MVRIVVSNLIAPWSVSSQTRINDPVKYNPEVRQIKSDLYDLGFFKDFSAPKTYDAEFEDLCSERYRTSYSFYHNFHL